MALPISSDQWTRDQISDAYERMRAWPPSGVADVFAGIDLAKAYLLDKGQKATHDWLDDFRPSAVASLIPATEAAAVKAFDADRAWDMVVLAARTSRYGDA
jgi:hypothetical protein